MTIVRIVIAVVFIGMGMNHFVPKSARMMAAMIPPLFRRDGRARPAEPGRPHGRLRDRGRASACWSRSGLAAGIALVVFLAAVFPANAYAAANRERFGALAIPFWPRLAGQLVLAALILWVAVAA